MQLVVWTARSVTRPTHGRAARLWCAHTLRLRVSARPFAGKTAAMQAKGGAWVGSGYLAAQQAHTCCTCVCCIHRRPGSSSRQNVSASKSTSHFMPCILNLIARILSTSNHRQRPSTMTVRRVILCCSLSQQGKRNLACANLHTNAVKRRSLQAHPAPQAAPFVAGVAAQFLGDNPQATPAEVKAAIVQVRTTAPPTRPGGWVKT